MAPAASAGAADKLYASLVALDRELSRSAQTAWFAMQPPALQESFVREFVPQVLPQLVTSQTAAAAMGGKNITSTVAKQSEMSDMPPLPELPEIVPSGFAGVASDGRPLTSLLAQPLIETYVNLDAGMPMAQAMQAGWGSMDQILATQVQDAGRMAQSVAMTVTRVTYYIRHVEPGACSRCIVLSGLHYKTNAGFRRHPKCRCLHIPGVSEYLDPADGSRGVLLQSDTPTPWKVADARGGLERFNAMSAADQDRIFGVAGAKAIRQGASINEVVNVRRGLSTASVGGQNIRTTTEGTTRRGSYSTLRRLIDQQRGETTAERSVRMNGKRQHVITRPRLMPEQIYRIANGDTAEEMRLLLGNGYITEGSFLDRAKRYVAASGNTLQ